jgi:hypothetical protein
LPIGVVLDLDDRNRRAYLHHQSEIGEFFLSSDAVIPSFTRERRISHIVERVPTEELNEFNRLGYTIGGMMIFPGNQVGRKMTINAQRGCHPRIKDRFDLTVECIRRYYCNELSPLSNTLERYADFFALFRDFRGYVEFFLLQDLVTEDCSTVKFFMPFDDFIPWPLPTTTAAYREYKQHALDFIEARNSRILASS